MTRSEKASARNSHVLAGSGGEARVLPVFDEVVGVDPTDPEGLIPLPVSLMPLECRVPQWAPGPGIDRTHTLTLWWRVRGVDVRADQQPFTGPLNPALFPYPLYVPVDYMRETDAVVEAFYTVDDGGGDPVPSFAWTLTVDNNPPKFQDPDDKARFVDPAIEVSGITEAVLAANPLIEVEVPAYIGRAGLDRVGYYLSNNTPPFPPVQTGSQAFALVTDPLILRIPAEHFRGLNNGMAYLQYRLYDRAGNFSGFSAPMDFQVLLTATPSNLPRPDIRPPAYIDFLIKRDDARAVVTARVPSEYDNFAPGDSVVMIWDGRPVLPGQTITGFPAEVPIPWSILRGPGPLALTEVEVHYEIHRVGRPSVPSPSSFFWVDLTVAGQDHANAPALLNPTLGRVDVFGKGSGLHNELDFRDATAGAEVWVRLYQNPVADQLLELYWNSVGPVAHYTVQPGDTFDLPVQFTDVPGSVIVDGGNYIDLPVYYTTSNGVNEQQSDNTYVNVHAAPLVRFDAPLIEHSLHGSARYLTCESKPAICHGVYWFIRDDFRFDPSDEIEFFWQGYLENNWEGPIDDTDFSITVNYVPGGQSVRVWPWETKIEPMRNYASATAEYFVRRGGALIAHSHIGRVRIDRISSGSGRICQPGDVGFCDDVEEGCAGEGTDNSHVIP
ncbi:hypothetical protein C4K03_2893 [Pseudomonas synxantha]|uniref:Uncharacterized protein n=1 Tax=Pseudomonas synxantha TaxID=47883 RepID=A0A3G7U8Y1_9PSED|nr:hypothetical protein [Pseudomonas synxantha]AZE55048.1 hypothetical protein C4K03_2893 [Pseudomonas synxantha]